MNKLENAKEILRNETDVVFSMGTRLILFSDPETDIYDRYNAWKTKYFVICKPITQDSKPSFVKNHSALLIYVSQHTDANGITREEFAYVAYGEEINKAIMDFFNKELVLDNVNIWDAFYDDISQYWSDYPEWMYAAVPLSLDDKKAIAEKHLLYAETQDPAQMTEDEYTETMANEWAFNSVLKELWKYANKESRKKPDTKDLFTFFGYNKCNADLNTLLTAYELAAEKLNVPVVELARRNKDEIADMLSKSM